MTHCLLCNRPLSAVLTATALFSLRPIERPKVCATCLATFHMIDGKTACPNCGRTMSDGTMCLDCVRWQETPTATFKNVALFDYNEAMKQFFQTYKFQGDYALRQVFQAQMVASIKQLAPDIVVPIPVHASTMATRGFNQVTGFLKPDTYQGLLKTAEATKQARQSQHGRRKRLLGRQPFQLGDSTVDIHNRTILIVDDVYTTGRTMRYGVECLQQLAPKSIIGLTLAR